MIHIYISLQQILSLVHQKKNRILYIFTGDSKQFFNQFCSLTITNKIDFIMCILN
jgi:hypothetical protein